jgi:protein-tyrosine kinase
MSKVHEALRRAQEERSSPPRPAPESVPASVITEASVVAPPGETPASTTLIDMPRPPQTPRHGPILPGRPSEAAGDAAVTAVDTVSRPPVLPERMPQPTVAGRDPRTGQFLRFEDLLKSCATPAWVPDPRTVAFSANQQSVCCAEQFRTLRTRLYHLRETAPLKRIVVTSALPGEGKTFVSTNLAQAIAKERERKVLLIDGDLRNPALHHPLGAPLNPGLSEYLRGQASDSEIIQHGQEGNLCFIPAGQPGPDTSELLSNGMLQGLLDRLAPLFDWVIIDSPPCLPVIDASLIAGFCDGLLLVVRTRSTPAAAVDKARRELLKRKVIGVVMNGADVSATYGSYGAYPYRNPGQPPSK